MSDHLNDETEQSATSAKPLNTYVFPITKDYVRHWTPLQAIREFLQNALDSDSPFEWVYDVDGQQLAIISRMTELPTRVLLLGATSKATAVDKIGTFGEGFKLAMVVLVRSGQPVYIRNGKIMWVPSFRLDPQYNEEILHVEEYDISHEGHSGLEVVIGGITSELMATVKDNCLQMQSSYDWGEWYATKYGSIMPEIKGKLYVGGLYICDTELQCSYDILPDYITLERDRQTVSGFELKSLSMRMWTETGQHERIAVMMEEGWVDVEWADVYTTQQIKDACYALFKKKHPGKLAVKTQEELDRLIKKGMTEVVYVGDSPFYGAVTSHRSYQAALPPILQAVSPQVFIEDWIAKNGRYMNRYGKKALEELQKASTTWRAPQ